MSQIPAALQGKYFFHFTHILNLESILQHGFLSTNLKIERGISHTNIANENIQHRRSEMNVTCAPFGNVHDYVPFYFATTNPMLLSLVNHKNIDQPFIIFFAISIQKILESNVVFTDASANTVRSPNFYNDPEDLMKLDWQAIDKTSWGTSGDDDRHKRMSEVLVYKKVPLEWIDSIIVWNEVMKKAIIKSYKNCGKQLPNIEYEPFKTRYFYFTKFFCKRPNETLVTGPCFLKRNFLHAIKAILKNRKTQQSFQFQCIADGLNALNGDFCCIIELSNIFELETANEIHSDNVSDHTIRVVNNLNDNSYFEELSHDDKNLVRLAAYLHDIGKGPKSKWKDGVQVAYPDHPADAIPMLERILVEEFQELTTYDIRKICLLVVYHDLIGDIVGKKRSKQELFDLILDMNELNMLIAISLADVSAIQTSWAEDITNEAPHLVNEVLEVLS